MEEDSGSMSKVSTSASYSNPLKKLKKKFNKLKHGGAHSKSLRSRHTEAEEDLSDTVSSAASIPSLTGGTPANTNNTSTPNIRHQSSSPLAATNKYPLYHQESFQSTGTASSLVRRTLADSPCSSFDIPEDAMSDSILVSEQDTGVMAEELGEDDEWKSASSLHETDSYLHVAVETSTEAAVDVTGMRLELTIVSGSDLIARDRNGLSDPYVKVKFGEKTVYKSKVIAKTLTPTWDETFTLNLESLAQPLTLRVFDRDKFSDDDFMGSAEINVNELERDRPVDLVLELLPNSTDLEHTYEEHGLGELNVRYILHTDNDQVVNPSAPDTKSLVNNIIRSDGDGSSGNVSEWDYIVRVVLIDGHNLLSMDDNGLSDPYVRFKLQNEKYKTKFKNKTLDPKWMEAFSLHLFDQKSWLLDIRVFDHNIAGRDDFMGRTSLDLSHMEVDKTHDLTVHLEDEAGSLRLLVTITGAVSSTDHEISQSTRNEIIRRYGLFNSFKNFKDVGWLQLKVIRAHGLSSKDWDGKSDPFCTVELVNTMLQSHTSYSTLNPEWNRVFTIPVNDIHSVLEVTVYDEDKDMKKEFIGKVAIPLIMIENGVQKWYGLKDKKLFSRVKGEVLLELDMVFNHVKAAVRTFNPREEQVLQEEPKFKISLFKRNVNRVRSIVASIVYAKNFWQSLIDWDYPSKTMMAFVAFMVGVWNFELYMLPLTLIMLFMWNLIVREIKGTSTDDMVYFEADVEEEEMEEEDDDKESKRSFREYIDVVKSICCTIQEILGQIANLGEAVKNSVNWTVPWLSTLAVVALFIIMMLLYLIPFRYILLLWGINKFTKKLRKPNYIPNNEVLDYLSRVPSDVDKMMYKEIRADPDRARSSSPQLKGRKAARPK